VVYADPPWSYRDSGVRGGVDHHYNTMTIADLRALHVGDIAAPDCALFMWATYPTLPDAFELMRSWGFKYKTLAFQWVKTYAKSGRLFVGLGHWTRGNTEPCFLAVRGKPKRVDRAVRQVVTAPVGRHSAKPAVVRDRIVQLMGDVPRVELFARERTRGWKVWGNEVVSDVKLGGER
jgi:N6-adenosine-specific RNA methylase IME4